MTRGLSCCWLASSIQARPSLALILHYVQTKYSCIRAVISVAETKDGQYFDPHVLKKVAAGYRPASQKESQRKRLHWPVGEERNVEKAGNKNQRETPCFGLRTGKALLCSLVHPPLSDANHMLQFTYLHGLSKRCCLLHRFQLDHDD